MTSLHHAPVDDADGLAFGARDGVRLHKANLGGDAEEFLDAFLDALFALLEILDRVGEHRAVEFDLHFDIRQLFARAHELYGDRQWKLAPQEALDKLLDFFAGRVRNYWQNRGEDSLLVDAALGAGVADVCQCGARLAALAQFSKEAGYAEAVQTFKRVANIVRKQGAAEQLAAAWQADLLQEDAEKALAATLDDLLPRLDSLWEAGDHTAALKTLLEVRPVVDAFFDGVMVMCDDAALRANRLAMLNALGTRFARLADFAALQI